MVQEFSTDRLSPNEPQPLADKQRISGSYFVLSLIKLSTRLETGTMNTRTRHCVFGHHAAFHHEFHPEQSSSSFSLFPFLLPADRGEFGRFEQASIVFSIDLGVQCSSITREFFDADVVIVYARFMEHSSHSRNHG